MGAADGPSGPPPVARHQTPTVHHAPAVVASLLRLAAGRVLPGALSPAVPFYERRIVVDLRTPTGLALYRYGPQDPGLDLVRRLVTPGAVVVDAGANVGQFSIAMALAMGDRGTVYAFEPVADTRLQLLRSVVAAGCQSVIVLPFALGETAATREFVAMSAGNGLSSFAPQQPELGTRIAVDVRRLDDVIAPEDRGRVTFMKLDVEGAEAALLTGAASVIAESRPLILVEVEDDHLRRQGSSAAELRAMLAGLGYLRRDGAVPPNELYSPADHP